MEERIAQLELITNRLMRRAHKKITGIVTPYPISSAAIGDKVEGVILRYMFPCEGKITKGMIKLGDKPKKWVSINIKLFNDSTSSIKGFMLEKKSLSIEPALDVTAGDCIEVSVVPNVEDVVTEVWISLLWKPSIREIEAKSFLITELEDSDIFKKKKVKNR
jgi:hypothetical protein